METSTENSQESTTTDTSTSGASDEKVTGQDSSVTEAAPPSGGSEQVDDAGKAQAAVTTEQTPIPGWAPNFKFKVKDKELEFDDFVKPVIKTKEVEAKLKELYEKAHGIEEVKEDRKTIRAERDDLKTKYTAVEGSLQTLGQMLKRDDIRSFVDTLKINKQAIIKYAIEELKYQELPPEQRAAIDSQRQRDSQFQAFETENQTLQQQMQKLVVAQAEQTLTVELANPTVNQAIQAFDARVGQPGAFRAEVIRRGQYYEQVHKMSPPASQLVQEILALVGGAQAATQAPGTSQGTAQSNVVVQDTQKKPAISTFKSGGGSPTKRVISSIDDIRKAREQLQQQS